MAMEHGDDMTTCLKPKPIPLITWTNMAPPFENHAYFQCADKFPFRSDAVGFDPVNAWWLCEAAMLAYAEEDFAVPRYRAAGFTDVHFFCGHATQCYVVSNARFAMVAFRGTECSFGKGPDAMAQFLADLGVDIDIRWVDISGGGKIHRGFHDGLDEIWDALLPRLQKLLSGDRTLWLTGHSMGGALATVTGSRLTRFSGIYTFGAPRVGNRQFASRFPVKQYCVVNNNDVVPHLPPFPYADQGELHYIDRNGVMHTGIDPWQRWKDEIQGHIDCAVENLRNLDRRLTATMPDGLKDHTPVLYALHLWNNLI